MPKSRMLLALLPVALGACALVKVSPQAAEVRLFTEAQAQAANCTRIGTASANVIDRVGVISRNEKKVQTELQNLAREEAAKMNGNVIVPFSDVVQGKQSFIVYQCPETR